MNKIVKIWDGTTPINEVSPEEIILNRKDVRKNLGDIFIVEDSYGKVTEIQFGKDIKARYQMDPNLTLEQVATQYLVELEKEEAKQVEEQITLDKQAKKISNLSINNANLLKDSATKTIDITNLKKHNATILIDNANKTKQINNLNKSLATVTLELAKLKAQK